MTKVSAVIKLSDGSAVLYSDNAKYNIVNNDTNFYNNVSLDYLNHKVSAENIDVFSEMVSLKHTIIWFIEI